MNNFTTEGINARRLQADKNYLEFLRSEALSLGLYVLGVGEEDLQQPHSEDEVYYVVRGTARFLAGDEQIAVKTGSVLFVPAGEKHRFLEIEEELELLVFFAPPEGRLARTEGQ